MSNTVGDALKLDDLLTKWHAATAKAEISDDWETVVEIEDALIALGFDPHAVV